MSSLSILDRLFGTKRSAPASRRNPRRGTLTLESLEKRQVMAGNVAGYVMGGDLNLIGGSMDNQIVVSEVSNATFKVEGLAGTTVNGRSVSYFYASNDRLNVNLGDGNDTLIIGSEVGRRTDMSSLKVNMGRGSDTFHLWSTTVYGGGFSTSIDMGDNYDGGHDRFEMGRSGNHYATSIWNSMSLSMGGGNDVAKFWGGSNVNSTLSVSMGNFDDTLVFEGCNVGRLSADLGHGHDTIFGQGLNTHSGYVDGGLGFNTFHGSRFHWRSRPNFQYVTPAV